MKKRIFSGVLAMAMLVSAVPQRGYAAGSGGTLPVFPEQPPVAWLAANQSGHTVSASQDLETDVGQTVSVSVSVKSQYNAYDLTLSYDTARLEYKACAAADAGASVTLGNGTLRILGYGRDKAASEAAATVEFITKAPGTALVTISQARIDSSGNARVKDAPPAAVSKATTKIEIGDRYPVTLEEGLTADLLTAKTGEDYTFRATDPLHYNYSPKASIGGKSVTVKNNGDGTYTIPGKDITGPIEVKANRTPKTYRVTLQGTDLSGAKTATYNKDYVFQLKRAAGYRYTLRVTIAGKTYTGYRQETGGYVIPGADVTGNIVITVQKTKTSTGQGQGQSQSKLSVSFIGSGAEDASGAATAQRGKDYTFRLNRKQGYTYTVSARIGGNEVTCTYDEAKGTYTIPAKDVTGDITVTVTRSIQVEVNAYLTLDRANMYLILYRGQIQDGSVPMYGGESMYYSPAYGGYTWLVISGENEETVKKNAAASVTIGTGTPAARTDSGGDIDLNGRLSNDDVRLAYSMYNAKHTLTDMEMRKFLNADVNADRKLDVKDSVWIVERILREK